MVHNSNDINKTNNHLSPKLTEHQKDIEADTRCFGTCREVLFYKSILWC